MNFSVYIIPVLVVALFIYAAIKKVPVFNAFIDGSKRAIPLLIDLLPYICAMLVTSALMEASGLNVLLFRVLSARFFLFGYPRRNRSARYNKALFRHGEPERTRLNFQALRRGQLHRSGGERGLRLGRNNLLRFRRLLLGNR